MPPKRVSELPLDPSGSGPVSQGVAAVDERGRIRLPAGVASSVTWLAKPGDAATALMVLEVPGRISLRSWEQFGEGLLARRRELIREAEEGDAAAEEDLLLLEDRYHRVPLPKERRLTLKAEGLLHLGILEGARSTVYIARVFDRIVITSREYRDNRIRTGSVALSDLP
jgi:hypothetical protein